MVTRTDKLTAEQRRKAMRAVRRKDTPIEKRLCAALWKRGYRYRKNYKRVIGSPDIVFVRWKIAIFCDSEFWHGYNWEEQKHDFKSNRLFWHSKIKRNIDRDKKVTLKLESEGWKVLRFWGREIQREVDKCADAVEAAIKERHRTLDSIKG
jgi:DNA mismatch endonuclease Vsr